jgi:hypothetical protein
MPDIMKMGKNPNYLGSWDLDEMPNREATLTIAKIVDEDVVTGLATGGSKERCTVCYWTDVAYKPMILNVTNKKTICKLYKTKDTDKLAGKAVVVGVEQVKAFGDVHDALRIRKRIPKVAEPIKCEGCGGTIQSTGGMSVESIIARTKQRYKACLCFSCATARAEKAKQQKDGVNDGTAEANG